MGSHLPCSSNKLHIVFNLSWCENNTSELDLFVKLLFISEGSFMLLLVFVFGVYLLHADINLFYQRDLVQVPENLLQCHRCHKY